MKKIIFTSLLFLFSTGVYAQIVEESSSYRWDKILIIDRLSSSIYNPTNLQCRTDIGTNEKIYQIYAPTTNQFDNFCLTIGNIDEAISSIQYLINFIKTSYKGDNKTLIMGNGDKLRIEKGSIIGKNSLTMNLTGCAGYSAITLSGLEKILDKLEEIK